MTPLMQGAYRKFSDKYQSLLPYSREGCWWINLPDLQTTKTGLSG